MLKKLLSVLCIFALMIVYALPIASATSMDASMQLYPETMNVAESLDDAEWTVLYIVAPILMDINLFFTWALNLLLLLIALRTDPIHPPQLHFDQEVISANRRKKNLILVCILLIQVASFGLGIERILIFSFNGILVSMQLVFTEKFKQKYGG